MGKSREMSGPYGRLNLSLAVTDLLIRLFDMALFYMVFRFIAEGNNPCLYNSVDVATFFYPFVYTSKLCKRSIAVGVIISWVVSLLGIIPLHVGVIVSPFQIMKSKFGVTKQCSRASICECNQSYAQFGLHV